MSAPVTNPFQPTVGPQDGLVPDPGGTNRGLCSLNFAGKIFRFRTNPNAIYWDYQLKTAVEETYGGRVIQILGTRLGDLQVKVECGYGGWPYLMSVVNYMRDLMSDQRGDKSATFEYTTRNWKFKVYGLSIPFQDEVGATTRELTLQFKIQEDVSGVASATALSAELARIQDGIYRPDQTIKNKYTDGSNANAGGLNTRPSGYKGQGTPNEVLNAPLGNTAGLANPFAAFMPNIPGLSAMFGGL